MTFPRPDYSPETIQAMRDHAVLCYPQESCGVVIAGTYVPCENLVADEKDHFRIDEKFFLDHESEIEAIIHSHPNGPNHPTKDDMVGQVSTNKIWGIVPCQDGTAGAPIFWGDFRLEDPLLGRDFVHGITDCYSIIRSWFWQECGILLPEFPRAAKWWRGGLDLYREGYEKAGFVRIDESEARPGDVFLGQVLSRVTNHGGVLLENEVALHHLDQRVSSREPVGPLQQFITLWLRYTG